LSYLSTITIVFKYFGLNKFDLKKQQDWKYKYNLTSQCIQISASWLSSDGQRFCYCSQLYITEC